MGKRLNIPQKEIESILNDYKNRVSIDEILNKYSISYNTFGYIRKKYKIPARTPLDEKIVEAASEKYMNGTPLRTVLEEFNISYPTIQRYFRKNGINYKSGKGRKHHFNENYFDEINSEHKAYWLGFLYADGNVGTTDKTCKAPNRLTINISSKDRSLLKEIISDLNASTIEIQDYIPDERTYGTSQMSIVYFNSVTLCNGLIKHGCIPNKTFNLDMPNDIPNNLMRHFIRGLFDGDGCITSSGSSSSTPVFKITGYDYFLAQIRAYMKACLNLKSNAKLSHYANRDPRVCDINFSSFEDAKKIYHYFYDNATIFYEEKRTNLI